MNKILHAAIGATLFSAATLSAFDNTQQNDFWDTTGYVNPTPAVTSAETEEMCEFTETTLQHGATSPETPFDSIASTENTSNAIASFSSFPPSLVLIVK